MMMRKLLDKMYKAHAEVFKPAKEDDIRAMRMALARHKMTPLPPDYLNFLQLTDGLIYNGIRFYGVNSHDRGLKAYDFPTLMDVNLDFANSKRGGRFLILGDVDEDYLVYDPKSKTYQFVDRMDLVPELNLPRFFDLLYLLAEELVTQEDKE